MKRSRGIVITFVIISQNLNRFWPLLDGLPAYMYGSCGIAVVLTVFHVAVVAFSIDDLHCYMHRLSSGAQTLCRERVSRVDCIHL